MVFRMFKEFIYVYELRKNLYMKKFEAFPPEPAEIFTITHECEL